MSTSEPTAVRTLRRYCRRFDARRLGSLLAPDARLDYFGRRVTGRRDIDKFVRQLPVTRHKFAVAAAAPPRSPRLEPDVEGDVTSLSGSEPSSAVVVRAPPWDSDENSMDVTMPHTPPRTPPCAMDIDGSPRTPDNPIPIADDILNAPRAPMAKRRRLHFETAEKVEEMMGVVGDVVWTEAVGRLSVEREREEGEEDFVGITKNVKLRLGTTTTGEKVKVVGIAYFDMMRCRKKLSFRDQD